MPIGWVASSALLTPKNRRRRIPHQMKPVLSAYQRYKARHIKAGLCVQCSRKPERGLLRCRVCRERERKLRMERHPLFCLECRKLIRPEERHGGKRFHKLCAQRKKARTYPQLHRLAVLTYQRRHRKMGLCSSCPRKAFKGGLCRKHYRMAQEQYYERTAG